MKVVVLRGITTKTQRFVPSMTDIPNVVDLDDKVADTFIRGGAAREATEIDIRLAGYVEAEKSKAEVADKPAPKPTKVAAKSNGSADQKTEPAAKDDEL